ncbi:hypothetical protein CMI38_07100 [Candidatus Pacearchaeota archaeon]|nr:hypothetical protein [Candidatus Pacearchaeota archaeon]|tara:strand:+ start:643 stop:2289 length:1647 start_codon:yes stop_codon:yes gene_type:complete
MKKLETSQIFEDIEKNVSNFTPHNISGYLGVSERNIIPVNSNTLLYFEKEGSAEKSLLHGSIFLTNDHKVIRGYPKIGYIGIYDEDPRSLNTEIAISQNPKVYFEEKKNGVNIRVFKHKGDYRFATRYHYDENQETNWASLTREIIGDNNGVYNLVDNGYIPILEVTHPSFKEFTGVTESPGIYLIDLIEDHKFVTTDKKREISEIYGVNVPELLKTLDGEITIDDLREESIKLNEHCKKTGLEGVVIKSSGKEIFSLKSKPRRERFGLKDAIDKTLISYSKSHDSETFSTDNAWPIILSELNKGFILKETNMGIVIDRYQRFKEEVLKKEEFKDRANQILSKGNFLESRELAKYIGENGLDSKLRGALFESYKTRKVIIPDTNFFYSYSVRNQLLDNNTKCLTENDISFIPGLEIILLNSEGDYRILPQVKKEFIYPKGDVTAEDIFTELNARETFPAPISQDHIDDVFNDIQRIRRNIARKRNHVFANPESNRTKNKQKKDWNDARLIAEYEEVRENDERENYIFISAEESVVKTVKSRGGIAIRF